MNSYTRGLKKKNFRKQPVPVSPLVQKKSQPKQIFYRGTIDYKNVGLLKRYITIEGKILPRRKSHLTAKQQRYIAKGIKNARMIGFLPFVNNNHPYIAQKSKKTSLVPKSRWKKSSAQTFVKQKTRVNKPNSR